MKKFLIVVISLLIVVIIAFELVFVVGLYISWHDKSKLFALAKTEDNEILVYNQTGNYEKFTIKGVNLGTGYPGAWANELAIPKDTYSEWFKYISEMGANTIRVYTVQKTEFYQALYQYNKNNPKPLYLLHGVWVNDAVVNSKSDAYAEDFYDKFAEDCKHTVDVIHGRKFLHRGVIKSGGNGFYGYDVSPWVIGYILGVEWGDLTILYTDDKYKNDKSITLFQGKYLYTTENASAFEAMLARVGDGIIDYETNKYNSQRMIAFTNWPTTDPFEYPQNVSSFFPKCASIDVENIKQTENYLSGQFASYHVYPYYQDFLSYVEDWSPYNIGSQDDYRTDEGVTNTYLAYLTMLEKHHTIPVVISEFGVSTGRGLAHIDKNTGRNQGHMTETEQGEALVACYSDIIKAGCAGGCVFTFQDEWFKRTWNTMYAVDLNRTPYWSDIQTNEQYFGLLAFDPGKDKTICIVDGKADEWNNDKPVFESDKFALYAKYDVRYVYFYIKTKYEDWKSEKIWIPIDTTPKSGTNSYYENNLLFDKSVDFMITVDGCENTKIQVQEYYNPLNSTYSKAINGYSIYMSDSIPDIDTPTFTDINLILQTSKMFREDDEITSAELFNTGKLEYGNADPESPDYNSLSDFCASESTIEIRIPWQILNFGDPSKMKIHDDYYSGNYGVSFITIDNMYVGVCSADDVKNRISLGTIKLKGWNENVQYHQRLKKSYYILKDYWTVGNGDNNGTIYSY